MSRLAAGMVIGFGAAILLLFLWPGSSGLALNPPAVLLRVQQLQQLATVRYSIQQVIGIREPKSPVGEESILLVMQAGVEAGIDLRDLKAQDIIVKNRGDIVLRLPRARVLNVIVDDKQTKVWDRQKTWWAPWIPYSLDLEQRARLEGRAAIEKAALEMGILTQAEQNAGTTLRTLLEAAGARSVLVVFGSGS